MEEGGRVLHTTAILVVKASHLAVEQQGANHTSERGEEGSLQSAEQERDADVEVVGIEEEESEGDASEGAEHTERRDHGRQALYPSSVDVERPSLGSSIDIDSRRHGSEDDEHDHHDGGDVEDMFDFVW